MTGDIIYGKSPVTGQFYKITDYEVVDEETGRVVAHEKKEVSREDVPDEWLEKLEGDSQQ